MRVINGILFIYHHPPMINAPTIMEHVDSFAKHSQFKIWTMNTEFGFPHRMGELQFKIIVLHYSLFGFVPTQLNPTQLSSKFLHYIEQCKESYKIAFFQDEHHYCQRRFNFLNSYNINCVYTLVEPAYFKDTYQKYTKVPKLIYNIPGYVSDDMIEKARKHSKPHHDRSIDVGYRGRQLLYYMGEGAQEKYVIGTQFKEHASKLGLKLDIKTEEETRLYGHSWYNFLGNCKACLGVEAGVSIFDTEDVARTEYEYLIRENPGMTFEQMSERLLKYYEWNIPYRTISPRHFESAAFRNCQILYEGKYSGIMEPMVHYIPLKKDFSNFDEVMQLFQNKQFCKQITDNCYRDIIASGKYNYRRFIDSFDQELLSTGFISDITQEEIWAVHKALELTPAYRIHKYLTRTTKRIIKAPYYHAYPGKKIIVSLGRPAFKLFERTINR